MTIYSTKSFTGIPQKFCQEKGAGVKVCGCDSVWCFCRRERGLSLLTEGEGGITTHRGRGVSLLTIFCFSFNFQSLMAYFSLHSSYNCRNTESSDAAVLAICLGITSILFWYHHTKEWCRHGMQRAMLIRQLGRHNIYRKEWHTTSHVDTAVG